MATIGLAVQKHDKVSIYVIKDKVHANSGKELAVLGDKFCSETRVTSFITFQGLLSKFQNLVLVTETFENKYLNF